MSDHFDAVLGFLKKIKAEHGLMQNTFETSSAENLSREEQATEVINAVTEQTTKAGPVTPAVLATRIEIAAALRPDSEQMQDLVHEHTAGLRQDLESDAQITTLPEGVGGQTDGSTIEIAADTVIVDANGMHRNRDQRRNVNEHEVYHREHGHLDALKTYVSEDPNVAVIIGGESFTNEAITEAVTVSETNGEEFVSGEYNQFVDRLNAAAANSTRTRGEIVRALNARDLTTVDDRAQQDKPDTVLAA